MLSITQPSAPLGVRRRHHVKPSALRGPSSSVTRVPASNLATIEKVRPGPLRTFSLSPCVVLTVAAPPTVSAPVEAGGLVGGLPCTLEGANCRHAVNGPVP